MLTWIKSFIFGLVIIFFSLVVTRSVDRITSTSQQVNIDTIGLFITIWSIFPIILIFKEKKMSNTIWVLFFAPFFVGMFLVPILGSFPFWIGLIISSTFIGHQWEALNNKEQ